MSAVAVGCRFVSRMANIGERTTLILVRAHCIHGHAGPSSVRRADRDRNCNVFVTAVGCCRKVQCGRVDEHGSVHFARTRVVLEDRGCVLCNQDYCFALLLLLCVSVAFVASHSVHSPPIFLGGIGCSRPYLPERDCLSGCYLQVLWPVKRSIRANRPRQVLWHTPNCPRAGQRQAPMHLVPRNARWRTHTAVKPYQKRLASDTTYRHCENESFHLRSARITTDTINSLSCPCWHLLCFNEFVFFCLTCFRGATGPATRVALRT